MEDHCRAVDTIIRNGKNGEIYNIGNNTEISNIELVKLILSIMNKPDSLISFTEDRKGHDLRYAIDNSKIINEFGFKPENSFIDNLKNTIEFYLYGRI